MGEISHNSCRQAERVSAFYDGELTGEARAAFESHLAGCGVCQAELTSLRELSSTLRKMQAPGVPAGLSERMRERLEAQEERGLLHAAEAMMGVAASLIIVAMLGLRLLGSSPSTMTTEPNPDWAVAAQHPDPNVAGGGQQTVLAQWIVDDLSAGRTQ